MKAYLKRAVGFGSHEWLRYVYHQFVTDPHYPPPALETLLYAPYSAVEKALYRRGQRSAEGLTLPDFIGIGGMHSGTGWLWDNLRHHPQIYLPNVKELQYFSWRFHRSVRYYSRQFEPHAAKLRGEISTDYGLLPRERIQFLRTLLPDVRLLFLMRDPIDRAWSHAKQCLMFRPGKQYAAVREAEFVRHFRSRTSRMAGDYLTILENWLAVFPQKQLYIGLFDDILRRPEPLLTDVLRHIGASVEFDWSSLPYRAMADNSWIVPGRQNALPAAEEAGRTADSLQDIGRWSDFHPAPIPPQYLTILEDIYADEIEKLYARFGASVTDWRVHRLPPAHHQNA